MPPQLSDDERSQFSDEGVAPRTQTPRSENKRRFKLDDEKELPLMVESDEEELPLMVESDEEEDNEEDDEIGEDEYVVESITDHSVDEDGNLFFEVKWEGFEKKSDRTMEPEANLADTASEVLGTYLNKIGGRESLLQAWEEKKQAANKGRKRARASTETNGTNGAKRGRKTHPAREAPSASAKSAEFKPPSGSWEDEVVNIDACEGPEGSITVYLIWKNGQKSQHPLLQVYKRCPQKMLRFYQKHLVFKKTNDRDDEDEEEEA